MIAHDLIDGLFAAAYGAIVLVAGYAAVSAAVRPGRRHWAELAGLSVAAGAGLTAFGLFAASLLGFPPARGLLAGWGIVAGAGAAAVLWWRGQLLTPSVPTPRRRLGPAGVVGLLGAAVVVAAVLNVLATTTAPGLGDMDEYATWMFKAKVLADVPLRPVPGPLTDPGLSYSHQDYPLLLPLLVDGVYAAVGRVDDAAGKWVLPPMYLALIGIVYAAVRRHHRRAIAVAVAAVSVAGPTVAQKAGLAVAELPLTLFLAAAVSMLARWADDGGEPGDLLLCGGFAAAAAFSKNEGLAMLPVLAVASLVVAARRRWLRDWWPAALLAALLVGPWLAYRRLLPKTHEDYGGKFTTGAAIAHGLARLPAVLGGLAGWMFDPATSGGLWIVLVVSAVVGWRAWRSGVARLVWVVLAAQLGLYVAAFAVTPWKLDVLMPMVAAKLLAQAAPAAGILIGLHLREAGLGPAFPTKARK
jgi:hypothetical protein